MPLLDKAVIFLLGAYSAMRLYMLHIAMYVGTYVGCVHSV